MKRRSSRKRVLQYRVSRVRGGRYLEKSTKATQFMAEWCKHDGTPYPERKNRKWYGRIDFITKKADRILAEEATSGVKFPHDSPKWDIPDNQLPNGKAIEFEEIVDDQVRRVAPQLNEWNHYEVYICNRVALITQITWDGKLDWERKDFHYVHLDNRENQIIAVPPEDKYPKKTSLELWGLLKKWEESHGGFEADSSSSPSYSPHDNIDEPGNVVEIEVPLEIAPQMA